MQHLTKHEFLEKHKAEYDTLSKGERERRWIDYQSGFRGARTTARVAVSARQTTRAQRVPKRSKSANPSMRGTDVKMKLEREIASNPLVRAMLDPFDLRWNGGDVPRVPDGEFAETTTDRLHDEFTITTDVNGGFCVFIRASPWAAIAASNGASAVQTTDDHFVAPVEFNAFNDVGGRSANSGMVMPAWTDNAWSVSCINPADTVSDPQNTALDYPSAASLFAASLAWRPVCAGMKLRYIGPPLTSSGALASAHWPGAYKVPTTSNRLLTLNGDTENIADDFRSGGPTFESVQDLVNGSVGTAAEGRTIIWSPDSLSVQKRWRPTKLRPIVGSSPTCTVGLFQVSDTPDTLEFVLPPPCTGDPSRFQSLVDRIYTQNNYCSTPDGAGVIGAGRTLCGVDETLVNGPARVGMSDALRAMINDVYQTDMMDGDNALIIIGQGLPPSTAVYICETVLGVEYIADTRSEHYGGGREPVAIHKPAQEQIEQHARAMTILHAAPASVPGTGGVAAFVDEIVGGVESVAGGVEKAFSAVGNIAETAAPVLEALGALFL